MIRPIVFGKFVLLERISVGGMAEVYRAKLLNAPHFNRFLAVKRILPNLAADDSFIRMFIDEAKITVELVHPNICQIYELGRLEDSHYIAMEFIPGRDLLGMQNRYRRQKKIMSVSQACFITAQVAQGLDFAHRAVDSHGRALNIVHRDVSPQNVLVSYEGLVKLIDFGVARAASQNTKTQAGVLKGKFGYMSPEQVQGRLEVDHRSDIFALGTVFWELLTGRRLFHADNEFATLELVKECQIELPSTLNRLIPPQIEQICMRALCPDPAYRYQWAGEMARDLWMFLNSCNPPYTQWHLQNWMCQNFAEDLEKEWAKLPVMQSINTVDDVRRYNDEQLAQAEAAMRAQMAAARPQQTFDFEGNLVPELHDIEDHKGERTEVFTPTFDFRSATNGGAEPAAELPRPPGMPPRPPEASSPEVEEVPEPTPDNPLHESAFMDAYEYLPEPARGRGSAVLVALLVLVLLGGGGFAVWFFVLRTQETEAKQVEPRASLSVQVHPDGEGISISVLKHDGSALVGNQLGAKVLFEDLEPGRYVLQVSHPQFEIEKREVTLSEGQHTVEIPMLRPLKINGKLALSVEPAEARVFAGDTELSGTGASRTVELEAGVEHRLVIKAPGYKPFETTITTTAERVASLEAELEKGVGTITIKASAPNAKVFYVPAEGEPQPVGSAPATVRDLDPTRKHTIEVRAKGYETRQLEITFDELDGVFDKNIFANMKKEP